MRKFLFFLFKKAIQPFLGKGLGRHKFLATLYNFLFNHLKSKEELILIPIRGSRIYINPRDTSLAPALMMKGIWEEGTTRLLERLSKRGMVFVDVGANIGYFTVIVAKLVGTEGHVYAFEPEPANYRLLKKSIEINYLNNVTAIQNLVSDEVGRRKLFLHKTGSGAHVMADLGEGRSSIEVEMTTLDYFFKNLSSENKISIVKIDVEGFEPAVFNGMNRIIKVNKDIKVIFEFWPEGIINAGFSPEQFLNQIIADELSLYFINGEGQIIKSNSITEVLSEARDKISLNLFAIHGSI